MKRCSHCKQIKEFSEFNKNKSKSDGLNEQCKICSTMSSRKYAKKCPWANLYHSARRRCTHKHIRSYKFYGARGIKFLMSMDDFKKLWYRDKAWLLKKPSIDRINSKGDYTINNCRYIEHADNSRIAHLGIKDSEEIKKNRKANLLLQWQGIRKGSLDNVKRRANGTFLKKGEE